MRREGRGTIQDPHVLKLQISSRTSVPLHTKPDRVGRNILAPMVNFGPGYINTHHIYRQGWWLFEGVFTDIWAMRTQVCLEVPMGHQFHHYQNWLTL